MRRSETGPRRAAWATCLRRARRPRFPPGAATPSPTSRPTRTTRRATCCRKWRWATARGSRCRASCRSCRKLPAASAARRRSWARTRTKSCARSASRRNRSRSCVRAAWSAERLDQVDVLLHRIVVRRALHAVPRVPLGAADHVAEAGLLLGVVALRRLLVQGVDLQQRGVVGPLAQVLRIGAGGILGLAG